MLLGFFTMMLVVNSPYPMSAFSINTPMAGKLLQAETKSVSALLEDLHSNRTNDRVRAKRALLSTAKTSVEARSQVIEALIGIVNGQEPGSEAWPDAIEMLGDLRAIEAASVLVKHLDYSEGVVGFSVAHFPALKAVIKIGRAAVPELAKALTTGSPSIRIKAAQALSRISGAEARKVLQQALATERNEEVKISIQKSLSAIR